MASAGALSTTDLVNDENAPQLTIGKELAVRASPSEIGLSDGGSRFNIARQQGAQSPESSPKKPDSPPSSDASTDFAQVKPSLPFRFEAKPPPLPFGVVPRLPSPALRCEPPWAEIPWPGSPAPREAEIPTPFARSSSGWGFKIREDSPQRPHVPTPLATPPRPSTACREPGPKLGWDCRAAWSAPRPVCLSRGPLPQGSCTPQSRLAPALPVPSPRSACLAEVVVLYGSPLDCEPIDARAELQLVAEALEASHFRLLAGVACSDSLPSALLRACAAARAGRDLALQLSVHIATSTTPGDVGLVLEDPNGKSNVLRREPLAQLLAACRFSLSKLQLLFLSSCQSDQLAPLFVEHGCRHVLAVKGRLQDRAARKFARAFYTALRARASLLEAFDCARQWLLIDPDAAVKEAADQFVLLGDRESAAKATLGAEDLEQNCAEDPPLQGLEEAATCLCMDALPPNPHYVGRAPLLRDILVALKHSRAFVLHGPSGMGKETVAVELARFASAPGRPFSCAAAVVQLPRDGDEELLFELLLAELERLALQHVGSVFGDDVPGSRHGAAGLAARASYVLQALERCRRGPSLVVISDRAGLLAGSAEARSLLGRLLDRTQRLHLVLCSTEPLYCFHGSSFRSINRPLQRLAPLDAARLLLRFKNRPLDAEDFSEAMPESLDAVLRLLAEHPLLQQLAGHPRRIRELAATKLVPSGPSLLELTERQAVAASRRRATAMAPASPAAVRQGLRC